MGELTSLTTTAKNDIVSAINEVNAKPSGGVNQLEKIGEYNVLADDVIKELLASGAEDYSVYYMTITLPTTPSNNNNGYLTIGNVNIAHIQNSKGYWLYIIKVNPYFVESEVYTRSNADHWMYLTPYRHPVFFTNITLTGSLNLKMNVSMGQDATIVLYGIKK